MSLKSLSATVPDVMSAQQLTSNRVISAPDASRHKRKCEVCNHAEREEIERRFFKFECTKVIASDFDLNHDSIDRHVHALGLRLKRSSNTEKVLEFLIARGIEKYSQANKEMSDGLLAAAITEYDKITGKQKQPAANPNDLEEARKILDSLRKTHGEESEFPPKLKLSNYQIFKFAIKPSFPELRAEQLEIVEEEGFKGDGEETPAR